MFYLLFVKLADHAFFYDLYLLVLAIPSIVMGKLYRKVLQAFFFICIACLLASKLTDE